MKDFFIMAAIGLPLCWLTVRGMLRDAYRQYGADPDQEN